MTVRCLAILLPLAWTGLLPFSAAGSGDSRLVMELFAEHPQIVTPTGIAVDDRGQVFVAESHTHFRPDDYDGPPADRILIFTDSDGDGRADHRSVFHEGFTHVMDIEFAPDGSLYVATRMDIHRLRDTTGDGAADQITPIVRMKTTGTYPHNGLSGLAFDFDGDLHFGLGENLGHAYTLIGSDGKRLSGGGEGGSTYHVRADGSGLRRVSRGWWNPFGMCVDAFGRVFGTDNDPGASPPCRLIQVIEGGDYGYEYRYGRTGLHPLVTWTGEMPGTLPMIAGTGEAPCAIVAYESDALPEEYRGDLLVASWADHRIEHYPISQADSVGLVTTKRQTLVLGDNEFRPVGLAIAPDGTVYVSDWVSSSYTLHKQGRIWRIRPRQLQRAPRPRDPRQAVLSRHRPLREWAARKLAQTEAGRGELHRLVRGNEDAHVRAAALQALAGVKASGVDLARVVRHDKHAGIRVLALRQALAAGVDAGPWAAGQWPKSIRAEAVMYADASRHANLVEAALADGDPLLFHAGVEALSKNFDLESPPYRMMRRKHELAWLLAAKRNPAMRDTLARSGLATLLKSANTEVRFAAIKWIADHHLTQYRSQVERLLAEPGLDFRLFAATTAALDRLAGHKPRDVPAPQWLLERIRDSKSTDAVRQLSLRLIDPTYKALRVEDFTAFLAHENDAVRLEAVRTLADVPHSKTHASLVSISRDHQQRAAVRAAAIAGLAATAEQHVSLLLDMAQSDDTAVSDEALRSLTGVRLNAVQKDKLRHLAVSRPAATEAVRRVLEGSPGRRPADDDVDGWLSLLVGEGNPAAGQRVFFATKVGTCSRCHTVDGRGQAVGPDLTRIRERIVARGGDGRRWLLRSILQPGRDMAPQYTPWIIVTRDGRTLTGLPRRKGGSAEAYLGLDGKEFTLKKSNIESHRESPKSIMPDGLLRNLTRAELNDLLAWLTKQTE